jgi:hypothetical protein
VPAVLWVVPGSDYKGEVKMPGFRHCSWCHGKGCIACDAEQTKWEARERERAARLAAEDPRARLARLKNPLARAVAQGLGDPAATAALDAEIAEAEAACDAEYARQFPGGPKPMFTARAGNPLDMELLKHVAHADVLRSAFSPEGGGIAEIEDRAAEARSLQALHDAAEMPREET